MAAKVVLKINFLSLMKITVACYRQSKYSQVQLKCFKRREAILSAPVFSQSLRFILARCPNSANLDLRPDL